MYLRLITGIRDDACHQRLGIFQSAYDLIDGDGLPVDARCRLQSLLDWFNRNLPVPDRSKLDRRAIFWFKEHRGELARRVWELAATLREHDLAVEMVRTTRPGYLVFEDDDQVAAIPFRDTFQAIQKRRTRLTAS